jgi:hypothetical protein
MSATITDTRLGHKLPAGVVPAFISYITRGI